MESNFDEAILFYYIVNLVIVTYNLWVSFATNIKKNSIVPWYSNPNFFKPDLFIVYTGNKYKNMIVDLDEKIRNLNWIFRLRVSKYTHTALKNGKIVQSQNVFRVITSKVKNNIFLLKLLRNSPRHYSLLIALFSDFNPLLWKIFKCDYGNLDGDGDDDAYRCQH